jgi:hypothetical protein
VHETDAPELDRDETSVVDTHQVGERRARVGRTGVLEPSRDRRDDIAERRDELAVSRVAGEPTEGRIHVDEPLLLREEREGDRSAIEVDAEVVVDVHGHGSRVHLGGAGACDGKVEAPQLLAGFSPRVFSLW